MLATLWTKFRTLKHLLKERNIAILVPIYKMYYPSKPESYWPIAVISHAQKIIDAAITILIQKEYRFADVQLGFQE